MSQILQVGQTSQQPETGFLENLRARFPYQFQQWSFTQETSSLYLRRGWHVLFAQLCEEVHEVLTPVQRLAFSWLTVKERFGAMRPYFAGELNPEIAQLVKQAEQSSTSICEVCGNAGVLRSISGSWATRCSYHAVERAARALLMREYQLSWAREAQIKQRLAQWMETPDPRWAGQPPRVMCATPLGTSILLELLMLQLEPVSPMH